VIGTLHEDLRRVRDEFVKLMIRYKKIRGHEITIVFDGYGGTSTTDAIQKIGSVEVVYTSTGKTADQYITELLRRDLSKHYVVVSSDRQVAKAAFRAGSVAVPSEAFIERVEMALEGLDPQPIRLQKGYTPSKQQKAILRALNKL